jgi:hypothetical protein
VLSRCPETTGPTPSGLTHLLAIAQSRVALLERYYDNVGIGVVAVNQSAFKFQRDWVFDYQKLSVFFTPLLSGCIG